MRDGPPPPPRPRPRVADLGASAQAAIPAFYAWGVTVAPAAWGKGVSPFAKGFAILGVVLVGAATLVERDRPRLARPLSVWGLAVTSVIVWLLAGPTSVAGRGDVLIGLLGALGWLLFAFASSAPPLRRQVLAPARISAGPRLRPRVEIPRFDALYVLFGVSAAIGLQAVGWRVSSPERAMLVRLVMLAAGLAVLGAATDLAVSRHAPRPLARSSRRIRRALPLVLFLAAVTVTGAVFAFVR